MLHLHATVVMPCYLDSQTHKTDATLRLVTLETHVKIFGWSANAVIMNNLMCAPNLWRCTDKVAEFLGI